MTRPGLWLLIGWLAAAALFSLAPPLDLWFSGLFYQPGEGFPLARLAALELWRTVVWDASIALFLIACVALVAGLFGRQIVSIGPRVWGFVAALYLLGPGLLVNGLLKNYWGRARPADVTDLGGALDFTPALLPSDQCSSNCSFVSGEGSAAVVLGIAVMVLLSARARQTGRPVRLLLVGLVWVVPLLTLLHRVATGRHFLSDSAFAVLFMLTLALVLKRLILRPSHGA